ncbi:FtsK/SpoIIIE domain-containing protein [Oceanobacillus caeni]|uniref:FtsK/SpoIIIE domain-containing protein n=1 Tax=Virgibacillus sp. SK37 TaxID=403957 RepID=UPI0011A6175A|nr:FtsK/SpoIIIE domain-containing protein [Virgibacillus sp. SK37]
MLTLLGYICIGASIAWSSYPAFESVFLKKKYEKKKLIENLYKAFKNGDLYKKQDNQEFYPILLNTELKKDKMTFIFTVPKGMNPDDFKEKEYVFQQHFGRYIDLGIDVSRVILKVYQKGLPTKINYDYDKIKESLKINRLPIVAGQNLEGNVFSFDLVTNPHILIAGETGGGKSSAIRSILSTLIQVKKPDELQLLLGDLKRSEFHLFKNIEHVEGVYHSANELKAPLKKIKREMERRGDKLDEAGVNSIDELKEKLPYIVICIDEVRLLKKEPDVMDIIEEVSSIGRSLGIFLILAMQRPDSKLLEGALKVNLTVRMGFKTADKTNSKIIGTKGAEKTNIPGRMILGVNSNFQEIQSPWLSNDKAKKLLKPYKVSPKIGKKSEVTQKDEYSKVRELLRHEEA